MTAGRLTVSLAAAAMATALAWGLAVGDLRTEGAAMLEMPWGIVSLTEIYVGITLFAGWVFWREPSALRACAWVGAILILGNIVSCVYVLLALRSAAGSAQRFWMGDAYLSR